MRLVNLYKLDKTKQVQISALLHQVNAHVRFYSEDNTELFFSDLSAALKYALNQGYFIENLLNNYIERKE